MIRTSWRAAGAAGLLSLCAVLAGDAFAQSPEEFLLPQKKQAEVQCAPASLVSVGGATVCGLAASSTVFAYEGIRYATAVRWQQPKPAALPAQSSATQFGNVCPQTKNGAVEGNEDCLFLNVWTPQGAITAKQSLPVMVFIHGGAFISGAGSVGLYDGAAAAQQGVVVVTLNYRLGVLGFLAGDTLNSGAIIGGNFGLMDQQMAMQWVKDNIAAFGGDPSKITLFGESAGAMSVALHTFDVPDSAELFSRAIMESNPAGIVYKTQSAAMAQGNLFLNYMCKQAGGHPPAGRTKTPCLHKGDWMAGLSTEDIVKGQLAFYPTKKAPLLWDLLTGVFGLQSLPWQPVVDGMFVIGEPYDGYAKAMPKAALGKTLALGTNLNEGTIFTGMAYGKLKGLFTKTGYNALLALKFGAHYPAIVKNDRYRGDKQVLPAGAAGYENEYSAAFANVMTDYAFTCGNLNAANQALTTGSAVFAYQFTQKPFFDLYNIDDLTPPPDGGACAPASGYTCHANELAYVFDTVSYIHGEQPAYAPTDGDIALARAMNTAWVSFAKGDTGAGSGWTAYAKGPAGVATLWNSNVAPGTTAPLDNFASCSAIWMKTAPYKTGILAAKPKKKH